MKKSESIEKYDLPVQPKQSLLDKRTEPLLKQAKSITAITSEDHFTVTGTIIPRIDEATKWIDAVSAPFVQAFDRLHKQAVAWKKRQLKPLADEKARILSMRMDWRARQERIAAAARDKLAAGLQRQEQKELERQAKVAERQGDTETAEQLRIESKAVPLPTIAPVAAVPQQEGFYVKERWDFEVIDPIKVPREFCCPDETAIRKVVQAMGGTITIPGVRIWLDRKEHSRSTAAANSISA